MSSFATTPAPPYYVVVFTSAHATLSTEDRATYEATADRMVELARTRPGFLGVDSVRDASGAGITVSYWVDEASIRAWRDDAEHALARDAGRARWYAAYTVRVARVERAYGFGE